MGRKESLTCWSKAAVLEAVVVAAVEGASGCDPTSYDSCGCDRASGYDTGGCDSRASEARRVWAQLTSKAEQLDHQPGEAAALRKKKKTAAPPVAVGPEPLAGLEESPWDSNPREP